jgi:6-phosphogluconolactonase
MPYYLYVSLQEDDRVSMFTMDTATGRLEHQVSTEVPGGPAPMAADPGNRFLYVGRRGACEISSYRIDQSTGELSLISTATLDTDPCYISTDRTGKFLLSSYYEGSKVTVHPIGDDGAVTSPAVQSVATARGAHSIQTDPSNRFAFVPHIAGNGPNAIFQFRFDEDTGRITPNIPATLEPPEHLGPRHFSFHPRRDLLYFSNEQGCSVTGYHLDSSAGTLTAFQTVSTLPEEFDGRNSCAQIQISPDGRFLYAPNRGHNSIACFSIAADGELTPIGRVSAEPVPRAVSLDPEGSFFFAAGLESGRLGSYRVNGDSGKLEPMEVYDVGRRPMWVLTTKLGE